MTCTEGFMSLFSLSDKIPLWHFPQVNSNSRPAPVRRWASRRRCSIPSEGSGLLGGSCLLGGIRACAPERRTRVAAGCCGSAPARRASPDTRGSRFRLLALHLRRSPGKVQSINSPAAFKIWPNSKCKSGEETDGHQWNFDSDGIGIVQVEVYMWRGNVQKVTVRSKRTGVNAIRVKSWSMYSNIISWRPHSACDVTPGLSLAMSFWTSARETATAVLERARSHGWK